MALPKDVQDAVDSLECEIADPEDCTAWQTIHVHLLSQDAEIERLRESNRNLHRRCQEAESALPSYRKLIALPPNGDGVRFVSGAMGRALLVSMCNKLQAHGDAADALLREVYDHGENMALHEKIDAHLSENTHDRA